MILAYNHILPALYLPVFYFISKKEKWYREASCWTRPTLEYCFPLSQMQDLECF